MDLDKKYPIVNVDGAISTGKQYDIDIVVPEDGRSVVYGVIRDCFGEAIPDAVVKLVEVDKDCGRKERKPVAHTFTDKDGEFVFGPLCLNKYYEILVWVNQVKHVKICAKCKEHKSQCLKGTKLDACDFQISNDVSNEINHKC